MSKSLKNFITIKDYLKPGVYSPQPARDLRLYLLQHKYSADLHFSQARIDEAAVYREKLDAFLFLASTAETKGQLYRKHCERSLKLRESLRIVKRNVLGALADDINTPKVLVLLAGLMREASVYGQDALSGGVATEPFLEVRDYLRDTFESLGVPLHRQVNLSSLECPYFTDFCLLDA